MNNRPRPLVSLIVPSWGDDELVAGLVERLPTAPEVAEWVIASVEPFHKIRDLERFGALRIVQCPEPSRGRQMNLGASVASGRLLCFHHADSDLQAAHLEALAAVATDESIIGGAFHRHFDNRHPVLRCAEPLMRRLSSMAGPLFGDQSLFVKARVFAEIKGFADIPLMEDLEFSRRLRRTGRVVLLDPPMASSARRFEQLGSWRTTALNAAFVALFYLGVSPRRLHRWYYRHRLSSRTELTRATAFPGELFRE
ncbi:MAG: TIGR04283 family arsenosugar biosynthesis glycosyltransferase [Terrimicrobiaceae bacterium]